MKSLDRFQFLANVLTAVCKRPNAEVGKLVKALVTYATEGTRTDLGDLRLEAYFDLIAQDLDSQRMAAEQKSRKCSESAKCRTARNNSSANSPAKRANVVNAANSSNATAAKPQAMEEMPTGLPDANSSNEAGIAEESNDFNASDATSSFDRLKVIFKKVGDNETQAFGVWQQLSEYERTSAFAHTQRMQGDLSSRSYLYVYLRDKEWTKATSPANQ